MPERKATRGRRRRAPGKARKSSWYLPKYGDLAVQTVAACVGTYLPPSTRKAWLALWGSSGSTSPNDRYLPL